MQFELKFQVHWPREYALLEGPDWLEHLDLTDVGVAEVYGKVMMLKQSGNFAGGDGGICHQILSVGEIWNTSEIWNMNGGVDDGENDTGSRAATIPTCAQLYLLDDLPLHHAVFPH